MSADERIIYEYTRCREGVHYALGSDPSYHYGSGLDSMYSMSLKVCAHVYPDDVIETEVERLRENHAVAFFPKGLPTRP